ncbi:FtsX-like permease family protein [Candidatus Saccharibacteria bacterium]|nr:FtsX-like permease family protein [Candidatus Saccharibacteria bacterium]
MKISSLFAEAGESIVINKGRSLLTILGIVIGIAAVTTIMGLGEGMDAKIDNEVEKLGSTNITIESRNAPTTQELEELSNPGHKAPEGAPENQKATPTSVKPTLTDQDLVAIQALDQELVNGVSPLVASTAKLQSESGDTIAIQGVSEAYGYIRNYELEFGDFFTKDDVSEKEKVVILGYSLANDIFEYTDPTGEIVALNGADYTVVGVLAETEPSQFDNPNVVAFVPYTTIMDQPSVSSSYGSIIVKAVDESSVEQAKFLVEEILLENHGYTNPDEADFTIKSSAEVLGSITGLTDLFRKVLMISAAVSLLVGGIGIMNIMLVSVTERTREIGLRKAVGAKTRHIMMQFLIEAIALTTIGGVLGVALGFIMASGLTQALDLDIVPSISVETVIVTAGISIGVGLLFGTYPAYKAAKLDPIDALRYE